MQTQEIILLVFTGILAFAVLLQSLLFYGIYRAIRQMSGQIDGLSKDLLRNIAIISSKVDEGVETIKQMGQGLKPIKEKLASATDIIHRRVTDLDAFLAETTDSARLEFLRIRDKVQSASDRAEEILEMLHDSILLPVHEINAVARGIKTGIDVLFRRRRNPSTSAQDEEMFI
jgi:methyl-accepting chemotaxis protein